MNKKDLCVVTGHNQINDVTELGVKTIKRWAKSKGYGFESFMGDRFYFSKNEIDKGMFFARYRYVAEMVSVGYERVLWLDTDVIPEPYKKCKDNPLEKYKWADLMIAPDINGFVNTGVMLWGQGGRRVLDEVCRLAFNEKEATMQDKYGGRGSLDATEPNVLIELLKENYDDILQRTKFISASIFNAQPQWEHFGAPTDSRFSAGERPLFLHLAGVSDSDRLLLLRQLT